MRSVTFEVEGTAIPKYRPRVVTRGKRRFAFTPKKVRDWERFVRKKAEVHFKTPFDRPVAVSMIFYMPRPKTRRLDFWVATTPDLDNLEKSVLDAMNKVAYKDDSLVVVKSASKRYVSNGSPRVEITVTSIHGQKSLLEY